MNRNVARLVGALLVGVTAVALVACGGNTAPPATQAPQATATSVPTAVVVPTSTTVPPTPTTAPSMPTSGADAQLELGRELFERTAGGIGCALCHGMDALGQGTSGESATRVVGARADAIRLALSTVSMMAFITLTDDEIEAIAAHLQWLAEDSLDGM